MHNGATLQRARPFAVLMAEEGGALQLSQPQGVSRVGGIRAPDAEPRLLGIACLHKPLKALPLQGTQIEGVQVAH